MSRSRFHRALLALALGVFLAGPQLSAAETRRTTAPRRATYSAITAWDLFTQLQGFFGSLTKASCGLDPHGLCSPSPGAAPAPAQLDNGCTIDPHGGCASSGG
jgi:hypothetical protein